MKMKKNINIILLTLTIGVLFSQNLNSFTQKITLENSLRDKIYSELERTFDKNQDRFVVIVNLELGRYGDLIDKSQSNSNTNNRGMEYLPGVPLSGSKGITNNQQPSGNRRVGSNDYIISEIDIEVWIEPSLANGANEKMIESLIKGIIPQTSKCDDCVTIETMNFNSTKNNEESEIDKLRRELNELKDQSRRDQMTELNLKLADLKAQLEDAADEKQSWEYYQAREDSIRLSFLEEERELNSQNAKEQRDDYLERLLTEKDQRIEDGKNGSSNSSNNTNDMEGGRGGSSITDWLLPGGLFLVALSAIAFLMILINKKSVVYLKPKNPEDNNANQSLDSKSDNKNESDNQNTQSENNNAIPQNIHPGGTSANIDESVVSSELKALRQSSISMSASQKEGATQIIKDWMDDGTSQNQSDNNSEGDK